LIPAQNLFLWQNKRMTTRRWVFFILSIAIGFGIGILYGWVISPVQYVDTSPDTLRADFRTDYVLMVAEVFQSERDVDLAARRLAMLGSQPPAEIAAEAAAFAQQNDYNPIDTALIEALAAALQSAQPDIGGGQP
jgi:hypothetical protein